MFDDYFGDFPLAWQGHHGFVGANFSSHCQFGCAHYGTLAALCASSAVQLVADE